MSFSVDGATLQFFVFKVSLDFSVTISVFIEMTLIFSSLFFDFITKSFSVRTGVFTVLVNHDGNCGFFIGDKIFPLETTSFPPRKTFFIFTFSKLSSTSISAILPGAIPPKSLFIL